MKINFSNYFLVYIAGYVLHRLWTCWLEFFQGGCGILRKYLLNS